MEKLSSALAFISAITASSLVSAASFDVEKMRTFGQGCNLSAGNITMQVNQVNGQVNLDFQLYAMESSVQGAGSNYSTCLVMFDLVPNGGERLVVNPSVHNVSYDVVGNGRANISLSLGAVGSPQLSTAKNWSAGSGIDLLFVSGSPIFSECGERISVRARANIAALSNGGSAKVSLNAGEFSDNNSFTIPVQTESCLK